MSVEEGDILRTLRTLRNRARPLGFYVGTHMHYDPARGGGPFYLMRRKEYSAQRPASLLTYATEQMIIEFLVLDAENYTGD